MERLNSLYSKANSKSTLPVTLEVLEKQGQNFFLIGVDGKNPWNGQTHKLGPQDVVGIISKGVNVVATPHIGLHWPSNSFYPHMGAIICDYSGNQSRLDYADEPEHIKEGFSKHNCAVQEHAVLSPYLQLKQDILASNGFIAAKQFAGATNLAYVHHKAKKLALGDDNVMLDSDLFDKTFTFDFFQVLIENQKEILESYGRSGILDRFVSKNGIINKCSPGTVYDINSFIEMKKLHKQMILGDCLFPASGFFPLNEVNILFDAISCYFKQIESGIAKSEVGDTYTIAGVDMINYTKNPALRDVIDRMYKSLLRSGKFPWLPKYIGHSILPGGTFTFLPSNKEEELYESVVGLLDVEDEKVALKAKFSQLSKFDEDGRKVLISESRNRINPRLCDAKDIFQKALRERRGFTQYDLLNGEKVPSEIIQRLMKMTFEEIAVLFKAD